MLPAPRIYRAPPRRGSSFGGGADEGAAREAGATCEAVTERGGGGGGGGGMATSRQGSESSRGAAAPTAATEGGEEQGGSRAVAAAAADPATSTGGGGVAASGESESDAESEAEAAADAEAVADAEEEEARRAKLLGFLQMVTPTLQTRLKQGDVRTLRSASAPRPAPTAAPPFSSSALPPSRPAPCSPAHRAPASARQAVFRAGDPVDAFFILNSGRLRVEHPGSRDLAQLDEHLLGEISAGEGFGESSLLDRKQQRTKSVSCASPQCEVVSIRGGDFLRLVEKSRLVRDSFESLHQLRRANNAATIAANQNPILKKYRRR